MSSALKVKTSPSRAAAWRGGIPGAAPKASYGSSRVTAQPQRASAGFRAGKAASVRRLLQQIGPLRSRATALEDTGR